MVSPFDRLSQFKAVLCQQESVKAIGRVASTKTLSFNVKLQASAFRQFLNADVSG